VIALFFEQLDDHGPGDLPGLVGIAKLFAFVVRNGLFADAGVEEIAGHGVDPRLRS